MNRLHHVFWNSCWLIGISLLVGCGKSSEELPVSATPPKPAEAANQLQQVFQSANPEAKAHAQTISTALQSANYEQAIRAIQTIKTRSNLTMDQGMAVYNSERALEAKLIAGVAAGDQNAIRAYELLKKSHRN